MEPSPPPQPADPAAHDAVRARESVPEDGDITQWLRFWQAGDAQAFGRVVQCLHQDFLRMAASRLGGYDDLSLSRGDVLNEAILRLMKADTSWQNRAHFFATVSLTMRSVLREHARARLTDKRGGGRVAITLSAIESGEDTMAADLLTLDRLMDELGRRDPRAAQVLEMTYFAGLKRADIALVLDVSVPTVDRELRFARAWLSEQLGRDVGA
ncbi:MAG: sigma-70 family RNA polymerase sigma factor [Burkholderiales bacterium]|nr:sigma-70 family RNA polymerase sigma factor [Burkholderiales bacterium]